MGIKRIDNCTAGLYSFNKGELRLIDNVNLINMKGHVLSFNKKKDFNS